MTEEIIIDSVNVAGCDAYKDKHCKDKTSIMFCDTNFCSNYPNCYYKQLKRLEQENNELKETVKDLNQSIQNCNIQRTKMYKALEEIKEIVSRHCPGRPRDVLDIINEVLK